jgi:nucleoid-associated protein EbfC
LNTKNIKSKREENKMSKRGGFPGMGGGFGGMNLNQLMKEAKKMQADLEKSQQELGEKEFEASAGGGVINVKVSGSKEIKEIKIKKEAVDPDDVEMLEDLILTCINEALRKVDSAQAESMGKYNIPGLM